ncbi:MAG: cyclopropane-fatty-acyl-phospholipid synthase [Sphingomonadales bacterium]|jgi:cyclopropane-fatty-acyl-phospholipid synthase|nr:cyclopropane-fatty-acyl-phospholipid synthase [Sphingomonadales bacterium]
MLQRGKHLVAGDRGFATGGGLAARLFAGGFHKLLDRIDRALDHGRIDATLPDGSFRTIGGRGPGPVSIMHIRSWRALVRLVVSGSVGWYVAWARGEWASPDPVQIFDLFMRNAAGLGDTARAKGPWRAVNWLAHRLRANNRVRARRNIAHHYDLGNDFYAAWLDPGMTYSSAIFAAPGDELEAAQAHKVRLLLDRLDLEPGQHLLEIGCGWGGLAEIAARDHGVHVTALTLSAEQKAYADGRLAHAGLAGRVDVALTDYRDVEGRFDAVASVEMVEAVGREYWPQYLESIARMLKPGGKAALQLIAIRDDLFDLYAANADFIQTYIFPGGLLIGEARFRALAQGAGLEWRDRQGYGLHYAETLKRWRARYEEAVAEGRLPAGFDDAFHQLWRYYLMYCEGGFRGGGIDVAQVTLVKK